MGDLAKKGVRAFRIHPKLSKQPPEKWLTPAGYEKMFAAAGALCKMAVHKKVLVKVGAFYALGKKEPPYLDLAPMIEKVVKAYGAKRCMWESDCPFQVVKHKYTDSVDLVRKKLDFLSPADKDWLLTKTAEGFFFPR
jgi:predicted TIM-barrel fold metal-dependent hydrolase